MKITHVIWARFPVDGYGGTERVCQWLAKAQAERGHEVTILCKGGRLPFASVREIPDQLLDLDPWIPAGTDIVQLYQTPGFQIRHPFLVNIGGNGQAGEKFHPNTVFVSKNHAERHHWTEYVHNGLDPSEYPLSMARSPDPVFLAKASWRVKNLKGAIKIAKAAGLTLDVAGGKAAFWHRGVRSHGTVGGERKLRLLQRAGALLFPIIWEEPFGLVSIEAMACGTPVVATPRGALPEIVTPGCGVLADSFSDLVDGLKAVRKISPDRKSTRLNSSH